MKLKNNKKYFLSESNYFISLLDERLIQRKGVFYKLINPNK